MVGEEEGEDELIMGNGEERCYCRYRYSTLVTVQRLQKHRHMDSLSRIHVDVRT